MTAAALIHRETVQLGILILLAVGAFVLTREVAASNRGMSLRDAAEWYRRGEAAIGRGAVDEAIESFRRARIRDRTDRRYALALARALALNHDDDAARSLLLALRESAPEDPDINLQLARLAAARHDVTEAVRFFHNALYAPWSPEQAEERRGVRLELIRFLLAHKQQGRATSELFALSADLPDRVASRVEVAQLFASAGDHAHALEQFQRALRSMPDTSAALAGAGQAAFRLGDYALARGYLRRAPGDMENVRATRTLVDLVLSHDPLAARIGSSERRRRLVAGLAHAQQRLHDCTGRGDGVQPTVDQQALHNDAQALEQQLKGRAPLEQDTVELGLDLIERIEASVIERCGPPTPLDQALVLIGRRHAS